MPRTIRFHLDEHVDAAIAAGLRRHGINVTTTAEVGLRGADDMDHIAFGLASGRVIYTNDSDFVSIDSSGVKHLDILYCHQNQASIGAIVHALILYWEILRARGNAQPPGVHLTLAIPPLNSC